MRFSFRSGITVLLFSCCLAVVAQSTVTPITQQTPDLLHTASSQLPHFSKSLANLASFSRKAGSKLEAEFHPIFGTPKSLAGRLTEPSSEAPEDIAAAFVNKQREVLKVGSHDVVDVHQWKTDELGITHVRMRFFQQGLEVWPAEAMVHVDESGVVTSFNGIFRTTPQMKTSPKLTNKAAIDVAIESADLAFEVEIDSQLLIYDWYVDQPVLAYKVHLHPKVPAPYSEEVFIDAMTGQILNRINKVCSALPNVTPWVPSDQPAPELPPLQPQEPGKAPATVTVFPTLNGGTTSTISAYNDGTGIFLVNTSKAMFPGQLNTMTLAGTIYVLDAKHQNMPQALASDPNGDGIFNDNADTHAAGAIAHQMHATYDWLANTFQRNSYDGSGSAIRTFANFRTDPSQGLDNAFWNGRELIFGDGGQITTNWAFTLDFATHEICHAITTSTADLVYQFQSGALNEAFSDMYAATQDDANWLLGETITLPNFGAPALRSMSNPSQGLQPGANGWQPANMSQYVNLQANVDNGGVHINSGIPNHAYYQLATAIGRDQAIQIMHRALTMYLTRNSEFTEARAAAERAAGDLYGNNSNQQMAVSTVFGNVGIGAAAAPNPGAATTTLYYPLTLNFQNYNLDFKPLFNVASVSDQAISGTATWYNNQGQATFTTPLSLNPHLSVIGTLDTNDFWVKIEADGPIVGAFQAMTPDGTAWAMMPATPLVGNGMFIPHIATDPKFWTVAGIANVQDTPSSVIYVDNLSQGYNIPVNTLNNGFAFDFETAVYSNGLPNASAQGGLWGFFMNYDLDNQKVLEQNMVGAEIFGRKDVSQAAGLLMDATSGRNLLFTHVAADTANFWTGYSVVNLDANPTSVNILAFGNDGSVLANTVKEMGGFGKLLALTGDASLPTGTSWFMVLGLSETAALAGMELFGTLNGQSITGFQASPLIGKKLAFPYVLSGSTNLPNAFDGLPATFTGISIINPNSTTATLTLRLYTTTGQVFTQTGTLAPGNKFLGTLNSIFGTTDFTGHVEVISDISISGFSLSGFANGQELASNPAVFFE